ncbi:neuropeptides capa receptor-like [Aplysia californica]|uniref:Neuropeptides capa receptor-like n=1 Tax=Aplysia californica TaxID=6500 RepID=A0ABM0JDS2_APLCA|nr:neuropeptides capa receptor-like [Aplysia californica]
MNLTTSMFLSSTNISLVRLTATDTSHEQSRGLVSAEVRHSFIVTCLVVIGQIVCLFGIGANIASIIIFKKHGFDDTVNISLFALAISDLGALVAQQWFNICVNPWFENSDIPFSSMEIQNLTAGYPRRYFTKTAGWITAFVTFERCLCIAKPLKVKSLITRRVAIAVTIGIYIIIIPSILPGYLTSYFDWKFYPTKNRTLLGLMFTADGKEVMGSSLFVTDALVPLLSFGCVVVCTLIIAVKLKEKDKWREKVSSEANTPGQMSRKNRKVVVMICVISGIFIFCTSPISALLVARSVEPELTVIGRYANLTWLLASLGMLTETVNSSINAVVYYNMSTKYRDTFRDLLRCRSK